MITINKRNLLVIATIANFIAIGTLVAVPGLQGNVGSNTSTSSTAATPLSVSGTPRFAKEEAAENNNNELPPAEDFPWKIVAPEQRRRHLEDTGSTSNQRGAFGSTPSPTGSPTPVPPDASPTPPTDTTTNVKGDPHFLTFGHEMFDYHGECDLVLLKNLDYKNMEIHIRTKITDWWSSVEAAAVQLKDEILEVNAADPEHWLWINGKPNEANMEEKKYYHAWIAGMEVRYRKQGIVKEANIYLEGRPERLRFRIYKDFVRVDVDFLSNPAHYKGAMGLLGSMDLKGKRVARDGETYIDSHIAFGQEWQVREDEPKLFHSYEGATVAPHKCLLPNYNSKKEMLRKRRLADGLSMAAIETACSHVAADERKECIYDVMATQDLDMASIY